jgi:hypothetical protein
MTLYIALCLCDVFKTKQKRVHRCLSEVTIDQSLSYLYKLSFTAIARKLHGMGLISHTRILVLIDLLCAQSPKCIDFLLHFPY